MPNETVEGADLAIEIGSKVKSDFSIETLPLMLSIIDTICDEKPLKLIGIILNCPLLKNRFVIKNILRKTLIYFNFFIFDITVK